MTLLDQPAADILDRPGPRLPRDEELDGHILRATVEILDSGEEITVSKVVKRRRVSRAVMYRRWPSITGLTAAALASRRTHYQAVRIDENLHDSFLRLSGLPPHKEHGRD